MNFPQTFGGHHQSLHDPYSSMMPPAPPPVPVPPAEFTYGSGIPPASYQPNPTAYEYGGAPKLAPPLLTPSQPQFHTSVGGGSAGGLSNAGGGGLSNHGSVGGLGGNNAARVSATNTNSKDPKAIKSRVFVGNLNTNLVTREQIHQIYAPFGEILAISMHKGYAFVQYAYENEARNAVTFTDGTLLGGKRIDVTISSEPKPNSDDTSGNKRSANVTITLGTDTKKPRLAPSAFAKKTSSSYSSSSGTTSASSFLDKSSSGGLSKTTNSSTSGSHSAGGGTHSTSTTSHGTGQGVGTALKKDTLTKGEDIIICGQCRQLFATVSVFSAHKSKCTAPGVLVQTGTTGSASGSKTDVKNGVMTSSDAKKPAGEPNRLQCFICHVPFDYAWYLLEHMSQKHNMTVYELPAAGQQASSTDSVEVGVKTAKKEPVTSSTLKKDKD